MLLMLLLMLLMPLMLPDQKLSPNVPTSFVGTIRNRQP